MATKHAIAAVAITSQLCAFGCHTAGPPPPCIRSQEWVAPEPLGGPPALPFVSPAAPPHDDDAPIGVSSANGGRIAPGPTAEVTTVFGSTFWIQVEGVGVVEAGPSHDIKLFVMQHVGNPNVNLCELIQTRTTLRVDKAGMLYIYFDGKQVGCHRLEISPWRQ